MFQKQQPGSASGMYYADCKKALEGFVENNQANRFCLRSDLNPIPFTGQVPDSSGTNGLGTRILHPDPGYGLAPSLPRSSCWKGSSGIRDPQVTGAAFVFYIPIPVLYHVLVLSQSVTGIGM